MAGKLISKCHMEALKPFSVGYFVDVARESAADVIAWIE